MNSKSFQKAIEHIRAAGDQHIAFTTALDRSIQHALAAGWACISARALHDHGTWEVFVSQYAQDIGLRTVQRYMAFTFGAMRRLAESNPELLDGRLLSTAKNPDKTWKVTPEIAIQVPQLYQAAAKACLESPVEFTALCREVGLMRKFTEAPGRKRADEARRKENRIQFYFDFAVSRGSIASLCRIDELPEAKLPPRADLERVAGELATALGKVRAILDRDASTIEA